MQVSTPEVLNICTETRSRNRQLPLINNPVRIWRQAAAVVIITTPINKPPRFFSVYVPLAAAALLLIRQL